MKGRRWINSRRRMIAANPVGEASVMFVAEAMPIQVGTVQRTGEVQ